MTFEMPEPPDGDPQKPRELWFISCGRCGRSFWSPRDDVNTWWNHLTARCSGVDALVRGGR